MKVARNAPTMPSTTVRMNPPGLFGPGEMMRARIPATRPTIRIYSMAIVLPLLKPLSRIRRRLEVLFDAFSSREPGPTSLENAMLRSQPARHFVVGRQPSVRRQMIDHVRQLLAEARQQIFA